MGNFSCHTDESELKSPIASCSMKNCGFVCTKREADPSIQQVNANVRAIAQLMRERMIVDLQKFGSVEPVLVLEEGAASPPPTRRLSLRIKQSAAPLIVATPMGFATDIASPTG